MPDADDFDVEYFRNLLQGSRPEKGHAPLVAPALPVAKKNTRRAAKPASPREKSKPTVGRKKSKNR